MNRQQTQPQELAHRPEWDSSRRGAVVVLLAAMMLIFVIMAAFTVDVAYMQLVRTELRTVTDASAKAGAEALARLQSEDAARAAAIAIANQNLVANRGVQLAPEDIVFGRATQTSDGAWTFQAGASPPTAVQVNGRMTDDSLNGSVGLFFARVVGHEKYSPQKTSIAAHMSNEIVLAVDRSHSMCFDLTSVDWSYALNNPNPSVMTRITNRTPQWQIDLTKPPHPSSSRWAGLDAAVNVFLNEVSQASQVPSVSLVTWASAITSGTTEYQLTGVSSPEVKVDSTLSTDYSSIRAAMAYYKSHVMFGGTKMSAGIDASIAVLTGPQSKPLANKTIVLMTDGQWNQGRDPRDAAADAAASGITIHTVTFLNGAEQSVMDEVAAITGGRHYHASNNAELQAAFQDIARSLPVALIK